MSTSLFNSRWVVTALSVIVLAVLFGAIRTYEVLPPVYFATSEIEIVPPAGTTLPPDQYVMRDVEIMRTAEFLKPVITILQLDRIWADRVFHTKLERLPMQDALGYMNRIISFTPVPHTSVIRITVASEVPKEAADIANALADCFTVHPEYGHAKDPAHIITRSAPPEFPSLPNHVYEIGIAIGIGIPLGILIATLLELLLSAIPASAIPAREHLPSAEY